VNRIAVRAGQPVFIATPIDFRSLFYPKSHAIIGASPDTGKFGGKYLASLIRFGYPGKLHPVNPQESMIFGLKAYRSVADIPEPVDLATIAVPAPALQGVLEQCLSKGIKVAQVLTSGFSEVGEEGRKLEEQLTMVAARGIRIIGPNCFGVYCPASGMTIMPGEELPKESGPVAYISQSGGLSRSVPRRATGSGIRFSKVVSYGNACDINECDLLEYLLLDPETKIIAGYLEGVKDGQRFVRLLQEAARTKPVILWKGGLTQAGARAVQSHTGSLGGQEAIWEAVFKQTGAVRVNSADELIDTAMAFTYLAPNCGRRVSPVSGGGAATVAAADTCERAGLQVPQFSPELRRRLAALLPPVGASIRNPVDVGTPFPTPKSLQSVLETILAEGVVDTIIISELEMSATTTSPTSWYRDKLFEVPVEIKERLAKPIVMVLPVEATDADGVRFEGERRKVCDYYLQKGIPVFLTLERAVKALAEVVSYYERRDAITE